MNLALLLSLALGVAAAVNITPLFTTYGDDSAARFAKGLVYAYVAYLMLGLSGVFA